MDVAGKVVLVTGGGGGIGAGIAEAFVEKGGRVAVTDLDIGHARSVAEALGGGVLPLRHDVTSADSWSEARAAVENALGPVDVLCNNAGVVLPFKPMDAVSDEEFDRIMAVNVRGVFLGCKLFMEPMRARGFGHIVNTSSVNGQLPHGTFAVYCASKFAVAGMSEALRQELEPYGVGVSILYPGLTRSRMSEGQVPGQSEEQRRALSARMMEPVWLGQAVVRAVETNALHIVTHPGHLDALKGRVDALYAAYGEPAQPGYEPAPFN